MKVRAVVELEVTEFSRHKIDGMLMECLDGMEGVSSLRTVGVYTDESGNPVSDDFFIVDENFEEVTEAVLRGAGVSEEDVSTFLESDDMMALHKEWCEYIVNEAEANMHGRKQFTALALKYVSRCAA